MKTTDAMSGDAPLLEINQLTVEFPGGRRQRPVRAVDDVSLTIGVRETVGLVGESGSGKSTIGRAVLGLVPATSGKVSFASAEITHARYAERRRLGRELQVIFQDPYSSLNPSRTIGQTLTETLRAHTRPDQREAAARVSTMLDRVGLSADAAQRYPAHFSGGQRQRIAIARALMAQPSLVICDEPTSALDLSVQAQVLNLLRELQDELHLSYFFISHDLAVVRHLSHRIIVLYKGRIMEQGSAAEVYENPTHPYTRALTEAAPVPNPHEQRRRRAQRLRQAPVGSQEQDPEHSCPFAPRCPHAIERCRTSRPPLEPMPGGGMIACHRWQELRDPRLVARVPSEAIAARRET
ncbi:ABC transporter ATP-binding protein [Conexibacter woesei]|uniref:Oligopeptide/dipeptide ABC transporter, ATPase subunit n=1 Tax=Conexibacter woesei (strain DSM 14684 / CCUG 47730 / CIP 108061 / JCM 11494 / NBRC 100937 / ID131577) TaxID=469383 RepID=D3FCH7_CONWI|nr:ABC transporter ATP-binding protein [Conexibacter woesei]ADB49450.1 oligopeptide/dipeptide ABC transporter, ATPase subunit [Conexibacter woesei DSM 14684]